MARTILLAAGLIAQAAMFPQGAEAQFYNGKTVTMIVNYLRLVRIG